MAPGFWFVVGSRFVDFISSQLERLPRCVDCGAGELVFLGLAPLWQRCWNRGGGRLVRVGESVGRARVRVRDVAVRRVGGGGSRG
jgi:hypothetical protein